MALQPEQDTKPTADPDTEAEPDAGGLAGLFAPSSRRPPAEGWRRNRAARIGLVTAVPLWPVGLFFSGVGLAKARSRRGAGRRDAYAGLGLSVLLGAVTIAVVALPSATPSYPDDPACAGVAALVHQISAAQQQLDGQFGATDFNIGSSSGAASYAALQHAQTALGAAAAKAAHSPVRGALLAEQNDVAAEVQQAQTIADNGYGTSVEGSGAIGPDTTTLDQVCGVK